MVAVGLLVWTVVAQAQQYQHHDWGRTAATVVGSYAVAAGTTWTLKRVVGEERPDGSNNHSFPSGHTAYAFVTATVLSHELGHHSPWVSIGSYGLATAVAVERVASRQHHWYDVCAGAAIGFGSTELCYWLGSKLFPGKSVAVGVTDRGFDLAVSF